MGGPEGGSRSRQGIRGFGRCRSLCRSHGRLAPSPPLPHGAWLALTWMGGMGEDRQAARAEPWRVGAGWWRALAPSRTASRGVLMSFGKANLTQEAQETHRLVYSGREEGGFLGFLCQPGFRSLRSIEWCCRPRRGPGPTVPRGWGIRTARAPLPVVEHGRTAGGHGREPSPPAV